MAKRKNKDNKQNNLSIYAKYSGLCFEMLSIIALGTFAGYKLDEKLNLQTPIFTLSLSLLSVFISLYFVLKSLKKQGNNCVNAQDKNDNKDIK